MPTYKTIHYFTCYGNLIQRFSWHRIGGSLWLAFLSFQGKGTEDTINRYQGCQLLFLDIPNIHAVRDSLYRLQGVCESSAQKKWLSHLESTQWLSYITSILKVQSYLHPLNILKFCTVIPQVFVEFYPSLKPRPFLVINLVSPSILR